jgi:hypothetical protein
MKTINEQLNLPLVDGGAIVYQPAQYAGTGTEFERSYNYPVLVGNLGTPTYTNATGWSGCNSCGGYSNADGWSNAFGVSYPALIYPTCIGNYKTECRECKDHCKDNLGLRWRDGGIACFIPCFENKVRAKQLQNQTSSQSQSSNPKTDTTNTGTGSDTKETELTKTGMSTGAKIGIAVGAVAVIGAIVYFGFIRKK